MSALDTLKAGLPKLRAEQPGPVALARLLWHAQRAEAALTRGHFESCWDQLWRVGQVVTPHTPGQLAWRELVITMLEVCIRGALKPQLAETLEQYGWLAWSEVGGAPWEALALVAPCEQAGTWSTGAHLGDLLGRQWPACPVGAALAGHFRELELLASGELGGPRMRAAATRFERALELATQGEQAEPGSSGLHVPAFSLRAGVALMLEGREKGRGRALLRSLKADTMRRRAKLWYAVGMARSDFWLDRVRAADVIDELGQQTSPDDIAGREELAALLRFLMSQDTLAMQPAEEDRLEALIRALAAPEDKLKLHELLTLKRLITEHGAEPPRADGPIAQQLATMSAAWGGDWLALSSSYQRFAALLDPAHPAPPTPPREAARGKPRIAQLAQEILHAARTSGAEGAIGALQYALSALDGAIQQVRSAELRPLVAVWPALLDLISYKPEDEQAGERRDHLQLLTARLFALWVERAPAPSQGWWLLSAHLARAGLLESAELAAQRAWGAAEQGDEAARDFASGKILAWVIEQGEPARMLRWLEACKPQVG